jgi:hypothetical protein
MLINKQRHPWHSPPAMDALQVRIFSIQATQGGLLRIWAIPTACNLPNPR